jgi:hypothetical protein
MECRRDESGGQRGWHTNQENAQSKRGSCDLFTVAISAFNDAQTAGVQLGH